MIKDSTLYGIAELIYQGIKYLCCALPAKIPASLATSLGPVEPAVKLDNGLSYVNYSISCLMDV